MENAECGLVETGYCCRETGPEFESSGFFAKIFMTGKKKHRGARGPTSPFPPEIQKIKEKQPNPSRYNAECQTTRGQVCVAPSTPK